jgi:hypothetical protein
MAPMLGCNIMQIGLRRQWNETIYVQGKLGTAYGSWLGIGRRREHRRALDLNFMYHFMSIPFLVAGSNPNLSIHTNYNLEEYWWCYGVNSL